MFNSVGQKFRADILEKYFNSIDSDNDKVLTYKNLADAFISYKKIYNPPV